MKRVELAGGFSHGTFIGYCVAAINRLGFVANHFHRVAAVNTGAFKITDGDQSGAIAKLELSSEKARRDKLPTLCKCFVLRRERASPESRATKRSSRGCFFAVCAG